MNNLSIDDILLINQISKEGSFTKAGDTLGIPKSSVSRRIKFIEDYLGVKLFQRSGRKVTPTHSTKLILCHTNDIESHWSNIVSKLKCVTDKGGGKLVMRNIVQFNKIVSRKILQELTDKYPMLRIEVYSTLKEPEADCFDVDLMFNTRPMKSPKFTNEIVSSCKMLFVSSNSYLRKAGHIKTPRDLINHRLIVCHYPGDPKKKNQWLWKEGNQIHFQEVDGVMVFDDAKPVIEYLIKGQGVAWLPDFLCKDYIDSGQLVSLFNNNMLIDGHLWAIYPHGATENKLTREFIDSVKVSGQFGTPFDGDVSTVLKSYFLSY